MVDWHYASIIAAAGLTSVFAVLTLLMLSMRLVGVLLVRLTAKKEGKKP